MDHGVWDCQGNYPVVQKDVGDLYRPYLCSRYRHSKSCIPASTEDHELGTSLVPGSGPRTSMATNSRKSMGDNNFNFL